MMALRDEILGRRDGARPSTGSKNEHAKVAASRPISFTDELIRSLQDGRKCVTRRLITPPPTRSRRDRSGEVRLLDANGSKISCRLGKPGDILWVRQRWARRDTREDRSPHYIYSADGTVSSKSLRWRPSFYMPREACRILLEITSIDAQRLQQITRDDALSEGFDHSTGTDPLMWFRTLWDCLQSNPLTRWEHDPWVWVIRFRAIADNRNGWR
jgi:hypothetical protein